MHIDQEIEKLKADIFADNWDKSTTAIDRLFEIGGKENLDYLIGLLDQPNSAVRNAVALTFRDHGFNDALEPLLKSIRNREFKGYTGTMVYALEKLDCSKKFNELFDLLLDDRSYEVQMHILTILNEQEFEFTKEDLLRIKHKWDSMKEHWNTLNHIHATDLNGSGIDQGIIQDVIDGYLSYLDMKAE